MAEEKRSNADLLTLFGMKRADSGEAASWAAIDNFIRQSKDMLYANSWHREQVNALLKRNHAECGHEGIYEPPPEPGVDDEMGNNSFINNTIISDKAAQLIAAAIGDENNTQPTTPTPPITPPQRVPGWWKTVLATLGAVLLGALLILLAWQLFGSQPRYELIAEPFQIPEKIEFQ